MSPGTVQALSVIVLMIGACDGLRRPTETGRVIPGPTAPAAVLSPVTGPAAGYVDDGRCAECHEEISRSYEHVGMGRSFYRFHVDRAIEDFQNNHFYHEISGRHYEMFLRDGALTMRRYQLDDDSQRYNEIEQSVDWVIGSGNHVRTYLYRNPAGELYELPVSWYTQLGVWHMSPGFDKRRHFGIGRRVERACLFCHNALPNVGPQNDQFGEPAVFPAELPSGIGCQRCHGPGASHIEAAERPDGTRKALLSAIVNPAKLHPSRRDDVCLQCHLQPSTRFESFVRAFGRSDYSYRPGEPLQQYLVHFHAQDTVFDPAEGFEINHHPYRLMQSICYQRSGRKMSCLTCHDPHFKVPAPARAAHYRDRCLTCHSVESCNLPEMEIVSSRTGHAAQNCIACHMGQGRPNDVIRVTMTDHLIQRRPPLLPPIQRAELEPWHLVDLPLSVYGQRLPAGLSKELYVAVAMVHSSLTADALKPSGASGSRGVTLLRAAIKKWRPTAIEPYAFLAFAELKLGRLKASTALFERLVAATPDRAWTHVGLGRALAEQGFVDRAIDHFSQAVELSPKDPSTHLWLGVGFGDLQRYDEAQQYLWQAIRLRPHYGIAYRILGGLLARQNKLADAQHAYEQACAIDPNDTEAAKQLGFILAQRNRLAQAGRVWRRAHREDRSDVDVSELLALLHLTASDPRTRNFSEGLVMAQHAYQTDPDRLSTALTLALALHMNDRAREAGDTLDQARNAGATEADCLLLEAMFTARRDQHLQARQLLSQAEALARENPSQGALRQMLLHLARDQCRAPE